MNRILKRLYPDPHIALSYTAPWELLVAVQLSAQCTDKRVNEVTRTLFKKYPTLADYVRADPRVFEKDISACGFYRNKTKHILAAARMIENTFGGNIPRTMAELLSLPGVARKTANVICATLYHTAFGIAVDTHVRRFAIRFDLSDYADPVRIERDLMQIMPQKEWWLFNHRLVHYGRDVCPARPHDCSRHPLTTVYIKAANIWPRAR
ncbi:MAG: endonuclease III [Patescibacteria group bacterium]|nr:endonuclease III [Patescibacteria group bacterium]